MRRINLGVLLCSVPTLAMAGCAGEDDGAGDSPAPGGEAGAGAGAGEEPDELEIPGFETYIGGKSDTGYVGSRAAELEATFTGRVQVLVPDADATQLQTLADELQANPGSWEHRDKTSQITEQIKYARNALKAKQLDLNLEGGDPTFTQIDVVEGGLVLHYNVTVESLVKFKELDEQGLKPEDLVGQVVEPVLPLSPAGLFEKTGAACTKDPDTGGTVDPHDLGAHNLFYYFDATQEGCPLTQDDLLTGRYEVDSSLDAPTVYPEYDRLGHDGRIDMVAIFGQITHGELKSNDWGFISFNSFTRGFTRRGFRVVDTFADNHGHRLEKTYAGGLLVSVTIYTPVQFADDVDRDVANGVFRDAMRDNEIIYYNGHAFYGSLDVLDDREAYPDDKYQIVFMDACWSYAYYTKQIFRNRSTDENPDGYVLADVINNTEPGITGSERTGQVLYDNIFKGTAAVRAGGDASLYSWNNMTRYMNEHAEERASWRTTYPDPEIYGASGVRTNRWQPGIEPWQPDTDEPDEPEEPAADKTRHESAEAFDVPDDDPTGAQGTIDVPTEGAADVAGVAIEVNIEHTFIGDLTVTLSHAGKDLVLHDMSGGSTEGLAIKTTTDAFDGLTSGGTWTLQVVDSAAIDTGRVASWAIEL